MNEFDDLADLDDVFGPLRSAARSAELSHERATVDLMVKAHRTSEGKHMFTSRRARIATLVAAGVLGFGGMAAASPSLGRDEPVQQDTVVEPEAVEPEVVEEEVVEPVEQEKSELVEEETPEPVVVEESEPAGAEPAVETPLVLVDDPDTAFDETTCLPGNHGKTVSAVARGEFPAGVSVTDAAHSSCGKSSEGDAEDETESEIEIEDETEIDDESEVEKVEKADKSEAKAERPGKSDKGAEKSADKGKSNGNAKSNGKRGG